jgi:hypothetical protein
VVAPWAPCTSPSCATAATQPSPPGALPAFEDGTTPACGAPVERDGRILAAGATSGTLDLVVEAYDTTPLPVPVPWAGKPVTPALLRWRLIGSNGRGATMWKTAVDVRATIPSNDLYDSVFARWTRQNKAARVGRYRFYLAHGLDTSPLPPGRYLVQVDASDTRGNTARSSFALVLGPAVDPLSGRASRRSSGPSSAVEPRGVHRQPEARRRSPSGSASSTGRRPLAAFAEQERVRRRCRLLEMVGREHDGEAGSSTASRDRAVSRISAPGSRPAPGSSEQQEARTRDEGPRDQRRLRSPAAVREPALRERAQAEQAEQRVRAIDVQAGEALLEVPDRRGRPGAHHLAHGQHGSEAVPGTRVDEADALAEAWHVGATHRLAQDLDRA